MPEQILEVHCLLWTATGRIAGNGCYTDLERAEAHMKSANKRLKWYHRMYDHRWRIRTLEVKVGKKGEGKQYVKI